MVLRIGGERRTFDVAFASSSSAAEFVLAAPALGQLQIRMRPRDVIAEIRLMAWHAQRHSRGTEIG
ncbi:MAG: hypothetical protein CR217_06905 [Beijerinckiaceae bacterium]|nr:MAG: hypothetical protein CR217_06905 [Beijerinckiaceae bacterium]